MKTPSPTAPASRPAISAEHAAKVQQCLRLLQEAQDLCDSAAQALCPVPGFGAQWSNLGRSYDAVKRDWHAVNRRLWQLHAQAAAGGCPCCGGPRAGGRCRCGFENPTG